MKWEKCGLIWTPQGDLPWAQSHATLPIVHVSGVNQWSVYLGCRDANGKTRIARQLLDSSSLPAGPPRVIGTDAEPVLSLGDPGTFDDSGAMPSWVIPNGDSLWMYYIGWN